jgi:hypothetical protein
VGKTGPRGPKGVADVPGAPGAQGVTGPQGVAGTSYNLPTGAGYLCAVGSTLTSSGETVSDGYDTAVGECLFPQP